MEDRVVIVIDDKDQTKPVEEKIVQILKREGLAIKPIIIKLSDRIYLDENQDLSLEKVLSKILEETNTYHVDVIACDYEFDGTSINGLNVIEKLRGNRFNKCPIILYTGKEDKVIRDIFNDKTDEEDKKQSLEKLIKCRIHKFMGREEYTSEIIRYLRKPDLANILLKKLKENGERRITSLENFKSYTLEEIANQIETGSKIGETLLNEIIELTISHYIDVNDRIS